jgi:hypothetical protein
LAQIAMAHGKSVSGLKSAMIAAERSRLDRARRSGLISSSQEQQFLSRLQSKISSLVNRDGFRPRFGPLEGPPPGPGWRAGPRLGLLPFIPPLS